MAAYATASQLETIVAAFRRASAGEGTAALERHRGRYLHSFTDQEGMVVISARLSPEDGAVETPKGVPLPARTTLPGGEDVVALHEREGLSLDEHTMPVCGEPYDLGLTVDALLGVASTRGARPSAA